MDKRIRKTFTGDRAFEASDAAEKWCKENLISCGRMQGPDPRGLLYGDYDIAKWRNLSAQDRRELHGTMTGDMRNGPITIDICERPTP